jgi:hypothetical protein
MCQLFNTNKRILHLNKALHLNRKACKPLGHVLQQTSYWWMGVQLR